MQSAECWLKTQAVCRTFQPNVGTFNANVVIGNEESHKREDIKVSRHTEQREVSHSQENFTNLSIFRVAQDDSSLVFKKTINATIAE